MANKRKRRSEELPVLHPGMQPALILEQASYS